jgi:hypothetical protein
VWWARWVLLRGFGRSPHADDEARREGVRASKYFNVPRSCGPSISLRCRASLCWTTYLPVYTSPSVQTLAAMRPASPFLVCSFARSTAPRVRPWLLERIPTPIRNPIPASRRPFHPPRTATRTRPSPVAARAHAIRTQLRHESSEAPSSAPATTSTTPPESRLERDQVPAYELTFTCKVCTTRSSHRISKQGYHKGTILISCPGCKNRHLISDHLKVGGTVPPPGLANRRRSSPTRK